MLIRSYTRLLLVVGACFVTGFAYADPFNPLAGPWASDASAPAAPAPTKKPFRAPALSERPRALPAMPSAAAWRPIPVVRRSQWSAWLDPASVTSGGAMARMALRAVSKAGAINVVYEGVDCAHQTYAIYAVGEDDGQWSVVGHPKWRPITPVTPAFQDVLYKRYLCRGDHARPAPQILDAIQAAATDAFPQDMH